MGSAPMPPLAQQAQARNVVESNVARSNWQAYVLALFLAGVGLVSGASALAWYGHPFPGVFIDSHLTVSNTGLPTWDGIRQGLRFPDRILAIDGDELPRDGGASPAARWDAAIDRAAREGRDRVHVRVATASGERELDLKVEPFGASAWWANAGTPWLIGALYALSALTAFLASPRGALARTFAKTATLAALLLFTFFDTFTSRSLVPICEIAYGMFPMAFVGLALRLPDDVPLLARNRWIAHALDGAGIALGLSLHAFGDASAAPRILLTIAFAASQFFFVGTIVVRFVRARGHRRTTLKSLLGAMFVAHVPAGAVAALAALSARGSIIAFLILPALALSPISTAVAFARHDLWRSGALLSRVATRIALAATACVFSVAIAAAIATMLDVPLRGALIAATLGGVAATLLVTVALDLAERGLFRSRAQYKPTIEQLSEDLTTTRMPAEVAEAVEGTVRRWLQCNRVEFVPISPDDPRAELAATPITDSPQNEVAMPVRFHGAPLGVLRVGEKRGRALFTSEDIDLLRTIANQAALALAHAHAYAELEARRQKQAAAWRDERAAIVETVAAEIAHEVRYPINFFRSVFARGARSLDDEEVEIGCEEVDRLERLVTGLKRVSVHRLERKSVLLCEIVARAEVLLRDAIQSRTLSISVPHDIVVRCDPDQVTQILVNLVANALEASAANDEVGVRWMRVDGGGQLVVWDAGPGFDADVAQLFAPWFTTKPRGTGLGLAITHRLVRLHGWSIDAARVDKTTRFIVSVPDADVVEVDAPAHAESAVA
jgi:signal transduction histidine kinase